MRDIFRLARPSETRNQRARDSGSCRGIVIHHYGTVTCGVRFEAIRHLDAELAGAGAPPAGTGGAGGPVIARRIDGNPQGVATGSGGSAAIASIFVPAYVSSPELTFGFMFALEDPERIAEVVRTLMVRRTVSVFRLAHLSTDNGPPERYVVNWAAIPQISITTAAPEPDELRSTSTMLVNAFLGEDGEVSLYSSGAQPPR
ncbi:hypothetical protein [Nocardia sp. CC227C]|uniref:hypothetical protein n=1 Tax=Nocardia sp. CC227C TaxID=3044562 RepID=UPI00278C4141|nr:hypothetical protein [Nocardia sp. CC227C]